MGHLVQKRLRVRAVLSEDAAQCGEALAYPLADAGQSVRQAAVGAASRPRRGV
jgi:hypothetical protein